MDKYYQNKLVISQRKHETEKGLIIIKIEDSRYEYIVKPSELSKSRSCHYCGMPATGFGFFDEPVCADCG
jgi:hypothetical protein